ncbi:competence type IV pilus assembly protein ComGB [Bacillus massiliglaciei]|uniref:competence type IV pilus assembly protein ComGB n=1 Tax=Bacillus massiliglaciei TaxID=1816693 RepID=UPI0018FEFC0C|nr:competence type IV pilus assembly protein ComGB [Bacillus massiliglaciei]
MLWKRLRRQKWRLKDQAAFLTKLGELLENGFHLAQAVDFLKFQENEHRRADLEKAMIGLRSGLSFHQVLLDIQFHAQLVSYVYYGEQYGDLSSALKEGGKYFHSRSNDLEKLRNLLVYPLFLFMVVLTIFYVLQGILLPKFEQLFLSMDVEKNFFMQAVLVLSAILPKLPLFFVLLLLALFLTKRFWYDRMPPLEQRKQLLKLPVAGTFARLYDTYFFSSQLSGLLSGGLSINESLRIFASNQKQPFYEQLCLEIENDLVSGRSLAAIFEESPFFERNLPLIALNGQKYGRLDAELLHYSRYLLGKIEERMNLIMKVIQPLLFSFIGLLIISIYLAVLLPMFSLLEGI